jgi:N-acetylneuraminic acid mutarotase
MPIKKYDFTMCVLDGCIYVISGRDSTSEIVDKCEKYDYVNDKWYSIAPVIKKRYAAACASVSFVKKIYLFGGRSENNNKMLDEIEEYNAVRDCWTLVTLKEPSTIP